jgi:TatD DNase family protein
MMRLIDTHCHLDVDDFEQDRAAVLSHCHGLGIDGIVIPAILREGWDNLLDLCRQYEGPYPALGLHPVFLDRHHEADVAALEDYVSRKHPVAIGEIGLDFFIRELDRDRQQLLFERQLAVARAAALPVILHVRKAHDEVLKTLRGARVAGGIAHAFNGSLQQARQYMELGFKLGFGGTLTYEKANKIRSLAADLPIEAIVLETDAPDMVVSSHRGERNSPEYLPECLQALATIRQEDPEAIALATSANARAVLNLEQ